MVWKRYFLNYRLETPLHIGAPALGNVQRTLHYIPGKTLWGATTAILTRRFVSKPTDDDYQTIGKFVERSIRFGYLFPEDEGRRLLPKLKGSRYSLGDLSKDEFEYRFLISDAGTAINPDCLAQHEGTLHETEYLYPKTLDGQPVSPLYFSGYIYFRQDRSQATIKQEALKQTTDNDLLALLSTLFIGANRRLGAGKLLLVTMLEPDEDAGSKADPEPGPKDWNVQQPYLASHLRCEPNFDRVKNKILGPAKPLVERVWAPLTKGKGGAGQHLTPAEIAWVPGSRVTDDTLKFSVGSYGRWQVS